MRNRKNANLSNLSGFGVENSKQSLAKINQIRPDQTNGNGIENRSENSKILDNSIFPNYRDVSEIQLTGHIPWSNASLFEIDTGLTLIRMKHCGVDQYQETDIPNQ